MIDITNKFVVQKIVIEADFAGQRIDNFLLNRLKGVPKSRIYRMLRSGEVRVNRGRVKPSYKLNAADELRIPPVRMTDQSEKSQYRPSDSLIDLIQARIIREDQNLIIINKPSGIASHSGSGVRFGVIEILRAARPDAKTLELVHRLDKETSGCIIIAKKRSVLQELHTLLRENRLEKRYFALLQGYWSGGKKVVDAPLLKNQMQSGERMVKINAEGKQASTEFVPRQKFADATLVEVIPHTGRTHQIRVHAAHIGHPIAGDEKYGIREFNQAMRNLGLNRLFLHAAALHFCLPSNGQIIDITADLDEDLTSILLRLK
jgi:23S rRNA pseudouridine955/2504/2580 synthase